MIFKEFANRLLGSKSKLKIALYFLSDLGPTGERELARSIGISHVAVSKALKEMESVNFSRKSKVGNVNIWSLNEKSYAYSCARDLKTLAKIPPLLRLKKDLETDFGKNKYIKRLVLFGSVAEGTEKETSDIDLFILVNNEENKKDIQKKILEVSERYKELYGNNISPLILTEKETKNKNLMDNIDKGIVIK